MARNKGNLCNHGIVTVGQCYEYGKCVYGVVNGPFVNLNGVSWSLEKTYPRNRKIVLTQDVILKLRRPYCNCDG